MSLTIEQHFDRVTQDAFANNTYKSDYLSTAQDQTSACLYGRNYNLAVALLAAHYITLNTDPSRSGSAVSGAISSKREGGLSISFAGAGPSSIAGNADLSQTTYGRQLQSLQMGTGTFMGVVGTYSSYVCGGGDPV